MKIPRYTVSALTVTVLATIGALSINSANATAPSQSQAPLISFANVPVLRGDIKETSLAISRRINDGSPRALFYSNDPTYAQSYAASFAASEDAYFIAGPLTGQALKEIVNELKPSAVTVINHTARISQTEKDALTDFSVKMIETSDMAQWFPNDEKQKNETELAIGITKNVKDNVPPQSAGFYSSVRGIRPLFFDQATTNCDKTRAILAEKHYKKLSILHNGEVPKCFQDLDETLIDRVQFVDLSTPTAVSRFLYESALNSLSGGVSARRLVVAAGPNTSFDVGAYAARLNRAVFVPTHEWSAPRPATADDLLTRQLSYEVKTIGVVGEHASDKILRQLRNNSLPRGSEPEFRVISSGLDGQNFKVTVNAFAGARKYQVFQPGGILLTESSSPTFTFPTNPGTVIIKAFTGDENTSPKLLSKFGLQQTAEEAKETMNSSTDVANNQTHLSFNGGAGVVRYISRTALDPSTGAIVLGETPIGVTCGAMYSDLYQEKKYEYRYTVKTLSDEPSACDANQAQSAGVNSLMISNVAGLANTRIDSTDNFPRTYAEKMIQTAKDGGRNKNGKWVPVAFRYNAFIKGSKVIAPGVGEWGKPFVYFGGDGRDFGSSNSGRYSFYSRHKFGSEHSVYAMREMGKSHRYFCAWGGNDCVEKEEKTAPLDQLQIKRAESGAQYGYVWFRASATNPLFANAPSIDADIMITLLPGGSFITGGHDLMPSHEINMYIEDGVKEGFPVYRRSEVGLHCLSGAPYCTTRINQMM